MSFKSLSIVAAAALALCAGAAQAATTTNAFANGGFETAASVPGQMAAGWRGVNGQPATRTNTDAHTGSFAALLSIPNGFNGAGLVQNSVDDGGMPSILGLHVGETPTLSFWAKGSAGVTGNINYSLRYLDSTGVILNPVYKPQFQGAINSSGWSQISVVGPAIGANVSAMFLEMTMAVGPVGVTVNLDNSVTDYGVSRILVDDVYLGLVAAPVPEPETYAMLLAGLAAIGAMVRRRRQSV